MIQGITRINPDGTKVAVAVVQRFNSKLPVEAGGMDQDKSGKEDAVAKQCVSLGAAIAFVSFFLLYFRPTWPGAFGVLALSVMGVWMTYLLKRPS